MDDTAANIEFVGAWGVPNPRDEGAAVGQRRDALQIRIRVRRGVDDEIGTDGRAVRVEKPGANFEALTVRRFQRRRPRYHYAAVREDGLVGIGLTVLGRGVDNEFGSSKCHGDDAPGNRHKWKSVTASVLALT
jgi:hypothetical protein